MDKTAPSSMSSVSEYTSTSSTKTDSNASTHSGAMEKHDVDDSGMSPIDMECHIQSERITKSLDKMVYQTKLALSIPTLVRDPILRHILSEQHLSDVRCICKQYDNPLFSASLLNMSAMEDLKAGDISLKHRLNPELSFMMYILSSYPELKPRVEKITEEIKNKYQGMVVRTYFFKSSAQKLQVLPPALAFLLKIEQFRDLMVRQTTTTAAEELSKKIRTRKLEENNQKELIKIAEYSKCIKEENEHHKKEMANKVELIAHLKREVVLLGHKVVIERKKQILDSERQMVLAARSHKVKYQMLLEEEVEARDNYNVSLNNHLITEKNLRMRRGKVETQLQSWLQKYDAEMTVKQQDLDELNKQYEEEVELKNEMEIKLAEQDKEFYPLMEERENEYHAEMEAKLNAFIIEHAARVIQSAWRATLQSRAEKKKLKKLLKKIEAEREAAARKAELEAKKAAAEEKKMAAAAKKAEKEAAKQAKLEAAAAKAAEKEGAKAEEA